jgi:predicted MPP superfamily phosphohydrolase
MRAFVLVVTAILAAAYAYLAWRLAPGAWQRVLLAVPFVLVWMVPTVYWTRDRDQQSAFQDFMHRASYLSMAWLSFLFVLSLVRDALMIATAFDIGVPAVYGLSVLAVFIGALAARGGPHVRHVDVPIAGLAAGLEGFRIALISDLHVGLNIGRAYVERVVEKTEALGADLIALTGDIVDGPIAHIGADVAPLGRLATRGRAYFVLGNHDCYSGADAWMAHFRAMGMLVLENSHEVVTKAGATLVVGGVVDPAYARQRPSPAAAAEDSPTGDFRLLLAHNPKLAPLGAAAGWDLQLSGHTHAGQFFPWTFVIRFFHQHVFGLSREGRMWVYVSAGTGTWGPPVRVGTKPELTLIRLVRAA